MSDLPARLLSYSNGIGTDEVLVPVDVVREAADYIEQLERDGDGWLAFGIEAGFCTSVYCDTHDGWAPEDDARQEALMDDFSTDHCTFIVRIKDQTK